MQLLPLITATLITVLVTVIFFVLDKKTKFSRINPIAKQIIIGIFFGISAMYATELGSCEVNGALINVRDSSPILAGLLFGPWSGVISGVIGGIDRLFIASGIFGQGIYTQVSCSIATILAGILAAIFKSTMFRNHRPFILHALVIIMITEVLHMALVPLTHLGDLPQASTVMVTVFLPLLIANCIAVSIAMAITSILDYRFEGTSLKHVLFDKDIFFSTDLFFSFEFWLLLIIIVAFTISVTSTALFINTMTFQASETESKRDMEVLDRVIDEGLNKNVDSLVDVSKTVSYYWSDEENYSLMIFDENGNILTNNKQYTDIPTIVKNSPERTLLRKNVNGTEMMLIYIISGKYTIVQYRIEKYEMFMTYLVSSVIIFIQIVIFGVMMLCVFILLRKLVTNNLFKINKSLQKITEGNLDEKVDVYTHKEFIMLSDNINATVDTLKEYIELEANRYNEEFELAQQIQLSALPNVFPPFPEHPEIDIYATYNSARDVGGDFYDYYFVDKNKLALIIADVSGKGIPAAMFMMRSKMAFRLFADKYKNCADTLYGVNNYLCEHNDVGMFVTAWIGIIDTKTGEMQVANAGHNLPVKISKDKKVTEFFKSPIALVLGGMENVRYKNEIHQLNPGDMLFVYTDGITEANDDDENLYGDDRLIKNLKKFKGNTVKQLSEHVIKDVDNFVGAAEQFDDMTTMSFIYKGSEGETKDMNFSEDQISVISQTNNLNKVTKFVDNFLHENDCPSALQDSINVVIDEVYSNIVKHGYKDDDKKVIVKVAVDRRNKDSKIILTFEDNAEKFNPLEMKEPDISLSAEERDIGGLGIFMIKKMMDDVVYKYEDEKNILELTKKFKD